MNESRTGRWTVDLPAGGRHECWDMDAAADAPELLARTMAELSHRIYARDSTEEVIETVLGYAVAGLDGCEHAGISLAHRDGRIDTPVATDDRARQLDELQYTLREGPCVHAIWKDRSFAVPDLANDARWPRYGPAAAELGARSMLAFRLYTDSRAIGALNLYSTRVEGFTEHDSSLALLLVAHAAVAIDAARTRTQLGAAIQSRQVIGEAIGILKERYRLTSDQAFDQLRDASQRLNVKLRDLADRLSTTGEEP